MRQNGGENGFVKRPLPRAGGWTQLGAAILSGRLVLRDGTVITGDPFAARSLPPQARAALHGFRWLDDLAAEGSPAARDLAQRLVLGWIQDHAGADPMSGADAEAAVVGRRLMAFVFHAGTILPGLDRDAAAPFFAALYRDMERLGTRTNLPFEALAGLVIAAMSLRGAEARVGPALDALTDAAPAALAAAALRRNPEALLDVAALIQWTGEVAADSARPVPPGLRQVRAEAVHLLAGLTDGAGGLIRAHGGGAVQPRALAALLRDAPAGGSASGVTLGFGRLVAGEAVATCDITNPPLTPEAHAAALSLTFAAHGQPLIGSCGTGGYTAGWGDAARATTAHSTLVLGGLSSSRMEVASCGRLAPGPEVTMAQQNAPGHLAASHDGWQQRLGLIHHRNLDLAADGRALAGADRLAGTGYPALTVALHFHLHPSVAANPDGPGAAALLRPPRGPAWRLTHDGPASLSVEPSVWLDPSLPAPLPAQQIVLRLRLGQMTGALSWRLTEMR